MNVESTVTDELGTVARSISTPPVPDAAALVRLAEHDTRRSRRRAVTVSGLVAAAVVGAVVLGGHLSGPDATPSPTPQPTKNVETPGVLRTGEPIRTWVDRFGRLHLDGTTVPGKNFANAQTTGDLTTAATGEYDTGALAVFLGTKRIGTIDDAYDGGAVAVSPDAGTLAYTAFENPARTKTSIVVVRVGPGGLTEVGRLRLDELTVRGDPAPGRRLQRVADDGTVSFSGSAGDTFLREWKPGSRVSKVEVFSDFPATDELVLNTTDSWGAWQTDPNPETPDAGATYRSVTVQRPGVTGSRHTFSFGTRYAYVNIVGWETTTDVLLYGDRKPPGQTSDGEYVRCDVEKRTCEVAPAPGDEAP